MLALFLCYNFSMELIYFTERGQLNNFVKNGEAADLKHGGAEFLQSWEWGELIERGGERIMRLGVREGKKIVAAATLIKKELRGSYFYWYAPRGPIVSAEASSKPAVEDFLFNEIKKLDQQALFLRIEPSADWYKESNKIRARKSLDLQPQETLILELENSEEELLAAMHQKTRYNIRLAEKKGVIIKPGTSEQCPEFWRLMNLTGDRDQFRIHDAAHYENLVRTDNGFVKLFLAEYVGRNIAAGLFCFWGNKVTYMHGASDNEYRNVMAPYLLQWSVIKTARAQGYKYYDFYGISEKKWPGVTRFKLGFGGQRIKYAGAHDLIFKPFLYGTYDLFRKLRRLIYAGNK